MSEAKIADTAWMARKSCAGLPVEWFMPDDEGQMKSLQQVKEVCHYCLVKQDCLDYALSLGADTVGIWGGTTQRERKRILQGHRDGQIPIEHGTVHGFYRERRAGNIPCAACRNAYHEAKNKNSQDATVLLGKVIELVHAVVDDSPGT